MVTLFPAGIDSFDIRSPQEVIRAIHMNDVQEAIVAIEVFLLGLNQSFNNHVTQSVGAHAASAISIASTPTLIGGTYPVTAANVQAAIEQLKVAIDQVEQLNTDVTAFVSHLNADINTAHPGLILGSKIANATITEDKLAFDIATQAELDTHISTDINSAHTGQLQGTRIATGTLPESALDFDVATQAELNAHIASLTAHNADQIVVSPSIDGYTNVQQVLTHINDLADAHTSAIEGVHGILIGTSGTGYVNAYPIETNAVVGRLDPQVVENKRLVAPYQGTKIVLFSDVVEDLEKEIFAPFHNPQNTDSQIIIRKPSASRITSAVSGGPGSIVLPVVTPSRFTIGDKVRIRLATSYDPMSDIASTTTPLNNVIVSAISGSDITVSGITAPVNIQANSLLINESVANPLFEVDEFGATTTQSLKVVNQQQLGNLVIDGDITVAGNSTFGLGGNDTINIVGALTLTGSGSVTNNFTVAGLLSAGSFSSTGSISGGTSLSITGTSTLTGNVNALSDITIGGDLTVTTGNGTFGGAVSATSFTATSGLYNGVHLPQFKIAFDDHLPSGSYAPVLTAGYQHHTDQLGYSSTRKLINYNIFPDGYYAPLYMHLNAADKGVVTESFFAEPFLIGDGYIQADKIGIFSVGDHVAIGDPTTGYYGRTITGLDQNSVPHPTITINDPDSNGNTDIASLDFAYAKIVKRISYDTTLMNSTTDALDAIALKLYSHADDLNYSSHLARGIGTEAFNFSSPFYTPTPNVYGEFSLQSILDQFGLRLYEHLDGYNPIGLGALDGYYVHPAKDISYDNSFSTISKRYPFTQDGYVGENEVYVPPTSIGGILPGDSVLISDDLPFAAEPFTILEVYPNDGYVVLDGVLSRDYYLADNPILSNFNIDTVQEAIEAIATGYDITSHLVDGYGAHNIKAISVDGSSGMPGFSASTGAEAFVELAGDNWNSAIHPDFYDHLFDLSAHLAANIVYDGYSPLLQSISPWTGLSYGPILSNDVQEALDWNYIDLHDHIHDPLDAHDATAISIDPITSTIPLYSSIIATNVQEGLQALQNNLDDGYNFHVAELDSHLVDPLGAHAATAISLVPFNNMVTDNLQTAFEEWHSTGDLVQTTSTIVNNQIAPASVTGLFFDPLQVRSAHVEYSIYRHHLTPFVELACAGTLRLVYKPAAGTWQWDITYAGDNVGVTLTVDASGQVLYTSTDLGSAPTESVIKFRARVTGV